MGFPFNFNLEKKMACEKGQEIEEVCKTTVLVMMMKNVSAANYALFSHQMPVN